MEYKKFCEKIIKEVSRMLGEAYSVRTETVVKNNQVEYEAIIISKKEIKVAPTIYLEEYYQDYMKGKNITDIGLDILVHYEKYKDDFSVDVDKILGYDFIKDHLYVKVINTKLNEERLKSMPHKDYYDLSMVVYAEVGELISHSAIMSVVNRHLELWEISKEELFEQAISNTREKKKSILRKMSDVLISMLEDRLKESNYENGEDTELDSIVADARRCVQDSRQNEMYVLTNECGYAGAVYILFDDIMKEVADEIGDDIYILPSSIHELILVPKGTGNEREELANIVKSVNEGDMDPKEILSNQVYLYDRETGIDCM